MNPAMLKIRREAMRWHLLSAINLSRPQGIYTSALLPIIQSVYPDASELELKRELDYLEERELVKIEKDPLDRWMADLTRWGVDIVEYTVECDAGVARPRITQS
jgi:hypothetical protein